MCTYIDCRLTTPAGRQIDFWSVRSAARAIAEARGLDLDAVYKDALHAYHHGTPVLGFLITQDGPHFRRSQRRKRQNQRYKLKLAARNALADANAAVLAAVKASRPCYLRRFLQAIMLG